MGVGITCDAPGHGEQWLIAGTHDDGLAAWYQIYRCLHCAHMEVSTVCHTWYTWGQLIMLEQTGVCPVCHVVDVYGNTMTWRAI